MFAKYLAEFVATFALVLIGAGSVCANALTGGALGVTGIALAHGFAIMVMVYATAHISGAHINPAVTFAMMVTKRINPGAGCGYIFSQLLGSVSAALMLKWIYPGFVAAAPYLGNTELAAALPHLTIGSAILLELVMTFFLVFVIYAVAVDNRAPKSIAGLAIGLTVALDVLFGGPLTGAALNPARAFGPALITVRWIGHTAYWAGPILGAVLAATLYENIFLKKSVAADRQAAVSR